MSTIAFAPKEGRPRIATGSWDGSVRLWDGLSGQQLGEFLGHRLGIPRIEFSPDGRLVASASWDGTARLWQVMEDGQELIGAARRLAEAFALELTPSHRCEFHISDDAE